VAKIKVYEAEILLDRVSNTDDTTGLITQVSVTEIPSIAKIQSTLAQFVGHIDQIPPAYSAVKVHGKEAYKRSRQGEKLELKARKVRVDEIQLLSYSWPSLQLKITTGPGVYIRSIARDLGTKLHTGGCLHQLRRTRVGEWEIVNCLTLEKLSDWWKESQT
jgi:tRNA pseudouridine55 synthase